MVGLMTLTWAWAENTLAMTIGVISKYGGPIRGYDEPPVSMKKRIACLRRALTDLAILEPLQKEGYALAVLFKELAPRRNQFVHSAAWQVEHGGFESTGVRVRAGQNTVEDHRFDQADAVRLNVEIAKLQDDAAVFMAKVCAIFDP